MVSLEGRSGLLAALLLLSAFVACRGEVWAATASHSFKRGMVISCPRAGQIWGSPEMARSLAELDHLGVHWIAIHPYAAVRRDGTLRYRGAAATGYLRRAVELATAAGMKVFWKPHLAYWGSFSWRGEIEFGRDDEAWRRFFDGYLAFIVDQASFAESVGVDLFAVGVEYEGTTHHEQDWRRIIASVRQVYSGRLTYAANWDSVEKVPFWDAVDLIGVHAYYPLFEGSSPDRQQLWDGWDAPLRQLGTLSRALGDKPVLFAEIGYARSPRAASEPWLPYNDDRSETRRLRRTLMEIALERIESEGFVEGMFWWKWIPGDDRWDRDFSMKDTEARGALEAYWGRSSTAATAQ